MIDPADRSGDGLLGHLDLMKQCCALIRCQQVLTPQVFAQSTDTSLLVTQANKRIDDAALLMFWSPPSSP